MLNFTLLISKPFPPMLTFTLPYKEDYGINCKFLFFVSLPGHFSIKFEVIFKGLSTEYKIWTAYYRDQPLNKNKCTLSTISTAFLNTSACDG